MHDVKDPYYEKQTHLELAQLRYKKITRTIMMGI